MSDELRTGYFSEVLEMLTNGIRGDNLEVAYTREGWAGIGLKIKLQRADANSKMTESYLYIEHDDGWRAPWVPNQSDMLADDWLMV